MKQDTRLLLSKLKTARDALKTIRSLTADETGGINLAIRNIADNFLNRTKI